MTAGDGYTCPRCGNYVWWNQAHNCTPFYSGPLFSTPTPIVLNPTDPKVIELLERIADALEKIASKDGTGGSGLQAQPGDVASDNSELTMIIPTASELHTRVEPLP